MQAGRGEWVVYHPPKSVSFGHQARIRDPRKAWPTVERFLNDVTRSVLAERISLTCHDASERTDERVAAARLEEARRRFGPDVAQSGPYRSHPHWDLDASQFAPAIEFALDDDKFPK
jgi:hypothetical protein